jgi:anti-sigma B factor antagonist
VSNFQIQNSEQTGVHILTLSGYLDAHTAPQFEKAIQDQLQAGNVKLVADCGGLTYISSAGLGVFMSFIEELREAGGDLKLCAIAPKVYQVFEVLGFPSLFEICDDAAAAIASFAGGTAPKGV